jgi:hypothetical protein
MKKLFFIILLLFQMVVYAQSSSDNPFAREDANQQTNAEIPKDEIAASDGPGDPGSTVPIDDYLPLLLVTAVGIIVHAGWRKRKQTA